MDRRAIRWCGMVLGGLVLVLAAPGCDTVHERMHVAKGNRLYNAEQYEKAIEEYEGALEVDPEAWEPTYRIATCYLELYEPGSTHEKDMAYAEHARRVLERCAQLEAPDEASRERAQDYYVGLLLAQGDSRAAITIIEAQLARNPTNPRLVQRLSGLYAQLGDFPKSVRYLERQAELEPDNAQVLYKIGVLCWDRSYRGGTVVSMAERENVVARGLAALEHALVVQPDSADTLVYINLLLRERAKVHDAKGRHRDAAQDVAQANEVWKRANALKTGKAQG